MNYDIFDEEYYLQKYPFVPSGIEQGIVSSGFDHFQRFGQASGFTEVSRYFDESYYLANHPEVANAVNSGLFASGLDHFIQSGYESGLTQISSDYDETFYLNNNRDLVPFIQNQSFRNGLEHFLKFGANEGRFANSFLDAEYLDKYPDIAQQVEAGVFRTGRHHYELFGQFEPSRSVTFVGGPFDDVVAGFGLGTIELIGVEVGLDENGDRIYESDGFDNENLTGSIDDYSEVDTLVGSAGSDIFVIGVGGSLPNPSGGDFYPFFGRAIIQNYDPEKDVIQVAGTRATGGYYWSDNLIDVTVSDISRYTRFVVEGASGQELNINYSGEVPLQQNFLENEYYADHPDVAAAVQAGLYESGLDHYQQVGQFEPTRQATFVGTAGNDTVEAFGVGPHDITGVEVIAGGNPRTYTSSGDDEFDLLIGSPGADNFIFGYVRTSLRPPYSLLGIDTFYRGEGEARIRGFNQAEGDSIEMVISGVETYSISPVGSDLAIAVGGDTIAILEGGANLTLTPTDINNSAFQSFKLV